MNYLDSKINDVKNTIGLSNYDSDDNSNDSNFSLVHKSNIRDNNLTLRLRKNWFHRGRIIYFHLHSRLGNNSRIKTCKVYRLPLSTIGTWFEKKCNISIWLPIVKSLSFNNVIKSIPISSISNSSFQS